MNAMRMFRATAAMVGRLGLCTLASVVGTAIGGALVLLLVRRNETQSDELHPRFLLCMERATVVK